MKVRASSPSPLWQIPYCLDARLAPDVVRRSLNGEAWVDSYRWYSPSTKKFRYHRPVGRETKIIERVSEMFESLRVVHDLRA